MFFDRPESGELAVLVHLKIQNHAVQADDPREFEELVLSAGGDPVAMLLGQRPSPDAKFFIGTGKVEELKGLIHDHGAQLVIFNHALTPSQERNLESVLQCRVLDRNGLILDIFAQRARTHEGKLQVELAQLEHMSTRLIRGWTHLERQKGGIGLRGPGETQLETDRRLLRNRIKLINSRLQKVRKQREQGRRGRARADLPVLSLVGYTNAGKSTLFNVLTNANVYVEDQLFATLDPTMRRISVGTSGSAVLADTVGFISHLPHRLIEAFRATLEEAANSDLLLHVIDVADDERTRNIKQVNAVLKEIGADAIPQLLVYNKVDLVADLQPKIDRDENGLPVAIWLSAKANTGIELLWAAMTELLANRVFHKRIRLGLQEGGLRARFYEQHAVLSEHYDSDGCCELEVKMPEDDLLKMLAGENISIARLNIIDATSPEKSHPG